MNISVVKYGGSSLAEEAQLEAAARHLAGRHLAGEQLVVVVSARGSHTDELVALAERARGNRLPDREVDQLLATGETASAAQLALWLHSLGVPARSLTGGQAGIVVGGPAGNGEILHIDAEPLRSLLHAGMVPVVAGFQGVDEHGDTLTLGRGGSDTTAVALAHSLGADCEILTDVDGVFSADPRLVAHARPLRQVSAATMSELAATGAAVLHPRAVELASRHSIPVRVAPAHRAGPGSLVSRPDGLENVGAVAGVSHRLVSRFLVHAISEGRDLARDVLLRLGDAEVPVDMVARSGSTEEEVRVGFIVAADQTELTEHLLVPMIGAGVAVRSDTDLAQVSVIGSGLLSRPRYGARLLASLGDARIETSWVSCHEARCSAVVPRSDLAAAVQAVHDEFAPDIAAGHLAPARSTA